MVRENARKITNNLTGIYQRWAKTQNRKGYLRKGEIGAESLPNLTFANREAMSYFITNSPIPIRFPISDDKNFTCLVSIRR